MNTPTSPSVVGRSSFVALVLVPFPVLVPRSQHSISTKPLQSLSPSLSIPNRPTMSAPSSRSPSPKPVLLCLPLLRRWSSPPFHHSRPSPPRLPPIVSLPYHRISSQWSCSIRHRLTNRINDALAMCIGGGECHLRIRRRLAERLVKPLPTEDDQQQQITPNTYYLCHTNAYDYMTTYAKRQVQRRTISSISTRSHVQAQQVQ